MHTSFFSDDDSLFIVFRVEFKIFVPLLLIGCRWQVNHERNINLNQLLNETPFSLVMLLLLLVALLYPGSIYPLHAFQYHVQRWWMTLAKLHTLHVLMVRMCFRVEKNSDKIKSISLILFSRNRLKKSLTNLHQSWMYTYAQ